MKDNTQVQSEMRDEIKELALTNALTDAVLILQELRDLKINLSLELQAQKDYRKMMFRELNEYMTELQETLGQIRAKYLIEAGLLDLVRPHKAGEKKWQKNEGESHSSQSRMLKQFAKNTH